MPPLVPKPPEAPVMPVKLPRDTIILNTDPNRVATNGVIPLYCGSWAHIDTERGEPFNLDLRHPVDYPGITFIVSSVRTMFSLQQVGPDSNLPLIETRRVTLREAREDSNGSLTQWMGGTTVEVVVREDLSKGIRAGQSVEIRDNILLGPFENTQAGTRESIQRALMVPA